MFHVYGQRLCRAAAAVPVVLACGFPAFAEEITVEAPITAVTVFPDRAEVTRTVEIDLPEGEHELVLEDLPYRLDTRSIRVEGEGTGPLELGAVKVTRKYRGDEARSERERQFREQLQELRDRDQALEDRLTALEAQRKFITGIGAEYPEVMSENIRAGNINPGVWAEAWTQIGSGMAGTLKQMQDVKIERRELKEEINKVQDAFNRFNSGTARRTQAALAAEAGRALKARLMLSYQVRGAYWRPRYDARLDTGARKVTLVQKGEINQATGEDWTGVRLTLSTARPAIGAERPELGTWFVDVARRDDTVSVTGSRKRARDGYASAAPKPEPMEAEEEPAPPPPPPQMEAAERRQAAVQATDFTAEYRIVGRVDVPSDGSAHTFPVTERTLDVDYSVHATPKLSTRAYLIGEMTWKEDAPIPGGQTAIFRDGAFIGNGALETVRPGETFELSFGVDDRVEIDYRKLTDKRSSEGLLGGEERITREYRIEVTNRHKEEMPITIEDQMPVPQDERLRVSLTRDTTSPSERDPEDRKGVVAWKDTYKRGETKTITFGYLVQYPDKLSVDGM
ncbi:MAG: mucoidy inhibitor MuiA family protein [Alphaproteobacteria bacterium]